MNWTVYILRCADGSLYTGTTDDLDRRVSTHNAGRGARFTRGRLPVKVVYRETARDRAAALRREWQIKRLKRAGKEALTVGGVSSRSTPGFPGFRPAAMRFLRSLQRNNRREWFELHRDLYEDEVRGPLRALVGDVDVRLAGFAPEIIGHPARSVFRIHRDVRFSKDKSPYKTNAACWFFHRDAGKGVGREAHGGAGFYFEIAPGECRLGAGLWMPPTPSLNLIRRQLSEEVDAFEAIVLAPAFKRRFGALDPEAMLSRVPRGFTPGEPAAQWLRYRSFTAGRALEARDIASPRLVTLLANDFERLTPLVRWLNRALGLQAATTRF
jgi:uncharacterized protein (TIGR02453 family)